MRRLAAARNPDGTWAAAISNYSSDDFKFPKMTQFDRDNMGQPARTFAVTLRLPELAGVAALPFRIHRNSATLRDVDEGLLTMRNGVLVVPDVSPLELITLRATAAR